MPRHLLSNLDHDPEMAVAVGNMVVAWSRAEHALIRVMWRITKMPYHSAAVAYYRIPTFEARVRFIYALLAEWETDRYDVDKTRMAIDKLRKLSRARNDWVHGNWRRTIDEPYKTFIYDYREADEKRLRPVNAAAIRTHSATVIARAMAIVDLIG